MSSISGVGEVVFAFQDVKRSTVSKASGLRFAGWHATGANWALHSLPHTLFVSGLFDWFELVVR